MSEEINNSQEFKKLNIRSVNINNFKGFKEFTADGLAQFNIISGDNNVGKTSFLEALCTGNNISSFVNLMEVSTKLKSGKNKSYIKDYLFYLINNCSNEIDKPIKIVKYHEGAPIDLTIYKKIQQNISEDELRYIKDILIPNQEYFLSHNALGVNQILEKNTAIKTLIYIPYYYPLIYSNISYSDDLVDFFTNAIQKRILKDVFLRYVNKIYPHIGDILISTEEGRGYLSVTDTLNTTNSHLINFGDGTIKTIRILLELFMSKDKFLCIDEIDTGIYYRRFKEYWKTVLMAAKENNVQLFATTHSKECLQYLVEAAEELGEEYQNEIRHVSMYRTKEGNIESSTYNYATMKDDLALGNEIR